MSIEYWPEQKTQGEEKLHIDTLNDALDLMARPPVRPVEAAMRLPVSGIYKIKGVGDVVAGRVEQGMVKPGEEVTALPILLSSTEPKLQRNPDTTVLNSSGEDLDTDS